MKKDLFCVFQSRKKRSFSHKSNSHNIFGKMIEFYNPLNCIKGGLSKNRTFDVKSTAAAEFASAFLEY